MSIQFLRKYKDQQVEGKSIILNDSSNLSLADITIGGDTKQETIEGYNKFNVDDISSGFFSDDTGTISATNSGIYTNQYIDVENNSNIYVLLETLQKVKITRFFVQEYDENRVGLRRTIAIAGHEIDEGQKTKVSKELLSNTKYVRFCIYNLQKYENGTYVSVNTLNEIKNYLNTCCSFSNQDNYEPYTSMGYNILPITDIDVFEKNGINIKIENQVLCIQGTSTGGINIEASATDLVLKANQEYTIATIVEGTTNATGTNISTLLGNSSKSNIITIRNLVGTNVVNYVPTEDKNITKISAYVSQASLVCNIKVKIMVVEGTYTTETLPDYDFFTYGARPSCRYPTNVQAVTGDVEIRICSKNEANLNNLNKVPYSSNGETGNYNNGASSDFIEIDNTEDYVFSYEFLNESDTSQRYIMFYDAKYKYLGYVMNLTNGYKLNNSQYFRKTKYIKLRSDYFSKLKFIQLEQNSAITKYEPYKGQTYLLELGSIEIYDGGYIAEENDGWYVTNSYIKKIINVAPTSVNTSSTNTVRMTFSNILENACLNDNSNKCNRLKKASVWGTDIEGFYVSDSYNIIARINKSTVGTTSESIQSYLQENETYVICKLSTPIKTKITDTILLGQLEALKEANSYHKQTHINSVTENLSPLIKVIYKKELPKMKLFI